MQYISHSSSAAAAAAAANDRLNNFIVAALGWSHATWRISHIARRGRYADTPLSEYSELCTSRDGDRDEYFIAPSTFAGGTERHRSAGRSG